MSRYDRQIAQAARMVAKYGQEVIWRKPANTQDNAQPWKTNPGVPTDRTVKILFLRENGGLANALMHLIKGTDVPVGGLRGIMAAVPFTPDLTDQVMRNQQALTIKSFDVLAPDGTPILYSLDFDAD